MSEKEQDDVPLSVHAMLSSAVDSDANEAMPSTAPASPVKDIIWDQRRGGNNKSLLRQIRLRVSLEYGHMVTHGKSACKSQSTSKQLTRCVHCWPQSGSSAEARRNRPPDFENIRRNVWVSKPRPKRMPKDDVTICNCKVAMLTAHAGAPGGCGALPVRSSRTSAPMRAPNAAQPSAAAARPRRATGAQPVIRFTPGVQQLGIQAERDDKAAARFAESDAGSGMERDAQASASYAMAGLPALAAVLASVSNQVACQAQTARRRSPGMRGHRQQLRMI